jgi:hypothetical protein
MDGNLQILGKVKLTQLQPNGLIIERPSGYFYDHTRLMSTDRLTISPLGIEATTPDGERVLDIHHIEHPAKAYDPDDLVCIGFTSHYAAIRAQFGEHIRDGFAGENIIIECQQEIWPEQLGQRVAIENSSTGTIAYLDVVRFAAPCSEFSHFVANRQEKKLPAQELKAVLQFLGNGRRGFLLMLAIGQAPITVQPGDVVYRVE